MPNLVITHEGQPPRVITVTGAMIGLGRDARNEISLPDPNNYVSRFHAVLVRMSEDPERYFIRDLSSMSGVFINGSSAYQRILAEGDVIQIAGYRLSYSHDPAAGMQRSRLRTVPTKTVTDSGATTVMMRSAGFSRGVITGSDREEIIHEFLLRISNIHDMRSRLDRFMPALVRVMNADRGFAGVFIGQSAEFEEIGATGMQLQDQIEIENPDAIGVVLAGHPIREETTLLAPICQGSRTVGFFCIDRIRPASSFTDEDAAFLAGMSRLVAEAKPAGVEGAAEEPLVWPPIFVGKSKQIAPLLASAGDAAGMSPNTLILGENGSGKELIAKVVHTHSRNCRGPFIARNCAALPEALAESELFGYVPKAGIANADLQGAPGWFELANHGTLFLDEIHALSPALQDKLLRVLEDRAVWRLGARTPIQVNVIVVAATDKDIAGLVGCNLFRRALYHRFARRLQLPSLRERKDDIRLLAHYFIDKFAVERGTKTRVISQRALDELMNYDWPGNVRELQNCLGACASQSGEILFSWDLPEEIRTRRSISASVGREIEPRPILSMEEVEREKITEALRATRGNITRASQLLGYKSRQTMLNKMDHHGIPRDYGDQSGVA
ncbi:MAG TPA: sigma 54-interacting transcriptional regulator [Bryobacteraceae bacterium]|nr:sigma 54-interacting transcriptional regulator [Bryobacteraceae bacterium]